MRAEAAALIPYLLPIPQPWRSVDELCRQLSERRGRELLIHALSLPALPFGLWFDDGKRDHIIHRAELTGHHRDHVILHEICHMLGKHNVINSTHGRQGDRTDLFEPLECATRNLNNSDIQEELAEVFASMALKLVEQTRSTPASEFEQRASAVFGLG